ncbi:HmuY family protein [Myxococcota bacterium]|nr:HmuY family protein [Myxococcota bacterium]
MHNNHPSPTHPITQIDHRLYDIREMRARKIVRVARAALFLGSHTLLLLCFAVALLWLAGCAPSLRDPNQKPNDIKVKTLPGPPVSLKEQRPGVWETQINASNPDQWIYFAFGQSTEIKPTSPPNKDKSWHLAFRRYFIKTNSGVSGEGDTTVALLRDKDFDALEKAPTEGYLADETGNNLNEPRSAFGREGEWYYYDLLKHVLAPRSEFLYVVRTAEKKYYKLQMLKYYDDKGNSGFPRFRYAELATP